MLVGSVIGKLTQSSLPIEESKAEKLAILTDDQRTCAKILLKEYKRLGHKSCIQS